MKLLIDMNLSPEWIPALQQEGWEVVHWSQIGDPKATDHTIMQWAKANGFVIFTHDLDFGTILAVGQMDCPSVIQIRTQDVHPASLKQLVFQVLRKFQGPLENGALVTVDESKARVRLLPIS